MHYVGLRARMHYIGLKRNLKTANLQNSMQLLEKINKVTKI